MFRQRLRLLPLMTLAQVCFGLAMMATTLRRTKLKRYHQNVPTIPKVISGLMPAYVNPTKSIEIGNSITIMYSRLWVNQIATQPPR